VCNESKTLSVERILAKNRRAIRYRAWFANISLKENRREKHAFVINLIRSLIDIKLILFLASTAKFEKEGNCAPMFFDIKKSDLFLHYGIGDVYANTVFHFFSIISIRCCTWTGVSIYDSEGSTKIYFHIEEYQGDAYVFNLRIIWDFLSFYEIFKSSFVESTQLLLSRAQILSLVKQNMTVLRLFIEHQ